MGTKNNPGEFDCYDAADPDEPMFILLARDDDAPERVDEWARKRFEKVAKWLSSLSLPDRYSHANKEKLTRELRKIAEALQCANNMREWHIKDKARKLSEAQGYAFPWYPNEPGGFVKMSG